MATGLCGFMAVVLPLVGAEDDDEDVDDVGWNAGTVALS